MARAPRRTQADARSNDGMISNKNYSEAERLLRVVDKRISGFVKLADDCAHYEPVAWWFTRNRIGRDLREQYKIPTELRPICSR